jgi:hypothetical protein
MAEFTATDGSKVRIDPAQIVRIRKTIYGENTDAMTRVDWVQMNLILEDLDTVINVVRPVLTTLIAITGGPSATIWVNATRIAGPFKALPTMIPYGYRSSIILMGYRQHAKETEGELRDMIQKAKERGSFSTA